MARVTIGHSVIMETKRCNIKVFLGDVFGLWVVACAFGMGWI